MLGRALEFVVVAAAVVVLPYFGFVGFVVADSVLML